jgi:hypothetical protein
VARATPPEQEDAVTENRTQYPVRVDASLDASLSRGLWLVKWLLLIPHFIVLAFLWVAFVVLSVVAFFAILVTGRYPRPLFEFNVGVLRWTWRVHYYGYGALGTDRYPPFTLADVPDYPAHLDVPYPERLSRGLVLVKWWLLALPHYVIVALFVGGGIWVGTRGEYGAWDDGWGAGGLVALLVLIAGVVLLFTGRYPRAIYDFVLGMDRWALRVAAYAGLMTDRYPPFRLDVGGADPGSIPVGPAPPPLPGAPAAAVPATATAAAPSAHPQAPPADGWTTGRIVTVVLGAILLFMSTGLLAGGGALIWADQTQREGAYLWTDTADLTSNRYALTSDSMRLDTDGADWVIDDFLGTARLEVTPDDRRDALFVGVADTADANAYLSGVGHDRLSDLGAPWAGAGTGAAMTGIDGGPPEAAPGEVDIWVAESSGTGTQTVDWQPRDGNWTVVIMQADGAAGLAVQARAGATAPGLAWLAGGLFTLGVILVLVGGLLVALAVHGATQRPTTGAASGWAPPTPRGPVGSDAETPSRVPSPGSPG